MMKKKALVLLSGGLDSSLAVALMQRQQIAVEGVAFFSFFSDGMKEGTMGRWVRIAQDHFGIPVHYRLLRDEFVHMVKNAVHGYGAGVNPCLDCKILMLRRAYDMMEDCGASFLVTGEVLGERPMSQHARAFELIERRTGLAGLIVRPLSGKVLPPTKPEEAGILNRNHMLAITGRTRSEQIALAQEINLRQYPQPAGGCILTDTCFARRLREAWEHAGGKTARQILKLRWGRHFRLPGGTKVVLGKDERENAVLQALAAPRDWCMMLAGDIPGPLLIMEGTPELPVFECAAALVKHYSRKRNEDEAMVFCCRKDKAADRTVRACTVAETELMRYYVG